MGFSLVFPVFYGYFVFGIIKFYFFFYFIIMFLLFQSQAGAEAFPQYGPGPGPGSWGVYDMQRAQGHR